ncbi:MAG: glycerate kinase [Candidatus Competibacterales bacterium]
MRIVVAPDGFKGSLTSAAAAAAMVAGWRRVFPEAAVTAVPVADGGEGTVAASVTALGGEVVSAEVQDPLGRPVTASYAWVAARRLAVIEMAAASGLPLLRDDERDPARASSYGTGQLILAALDRGAEQLVVGLGGSATVDGGSGCLEALGARFYTSSTQAVRATGGALAFVETIDLSGLDGRLAQTALTLASDVDNPLLGATGAVGVFGPQKGVVVDALETFDAGMAHFADVLERATGRRRRDAPGAGAAGGLGFALMAAFDAEYKSGFALVAELAGLEAAIAQADLVITGEGRLDAQSPRGKVVGGLARLAARHGTPVAVLAGAVALDPAELADLGIQVALPIVEGPTSTSDAMAAGATLVERAAWRLAAALALGQRLAIA